MEEPESDLVDVVGARAASTVADSDAVMDGGDDAARREGGDSSDTAAAVAHNSPPVEECTTIRISIRELNKVLVCPLCDGYYRDAQTIPECLHSYCKVCIYKYLYDRESREGQCPLCLVSLGHSPHTKLLPDINLQAIVDKVFPHFLEEDRRLKTEFEEREKAAVAAEG